MAEKNRNVNLEEIDADTLFGIDALKHQTMFQKILFFGMLLGGILENVLLTYFTEIHPAVCVVIFLIMLMIGIAFGCNYTEDMTYGKYLYYFFFKPSKELKYRSTEDIREIRKAAELIRKEDERKLTMERQADPGEQRKLLIRVLTFVIVLTIILIAVLVYSVIRNGTVMHYTVDAVSKNMQVRQ